MPNGTYGGVRGGRKSLLLDLFTITGPFFTFELGNSLYFKLNNVNESTIIYTIGETDEKV